MNLSLGRLITCLLFALPQLILLRAKHSVVTQEDLTMGEKGVDFKRTKTELRHS